MKSKVSFYNQEIIRNNFRMYGLLSVFWGIILFILIPLLLVQSGDISNSWRLENYLKGIGMALSFTVPPCMGIAYFGFLKKENSTSFYMSLPATGTQIFVSQYLSAFLLYMLPILANVVLLAILSLMRPDTLQIIANWLLMMALLFFINFTISVGIGLITGSPIWNILFVMVYYILPTFFGLSIDFMINRVLFGFANSNVMIDAFINIDIFRISIDFVNRNEVTVGEYFLYLIVYLVLVLTLASIIYAYKKMENNKEWICFTFFKYFFVVGFTACSAFLMGAAFIEVIFRGSGNFSYYLGIGVGAVLGYMISAMIAWKTIYLKKRWWGSFVALAVVLAVVGMVDADFLMVERKIPPVSKIKSITMNHQGTYREIESGRGLTVSNMDYRREYTFEEVENIERIRKIHQVILNNRNKDYHLFSQEKMRGVNLVYELKSGEKIERRYLNTLLPDYEQEYEELALSPEFMMQEYRLLNPVVSERIRKIKISTDFVAIEESFTGDKKEELIQLVTEEIKHLAKTRTKLEIRKNNHAGIALLKQTPIRLSFEEVESKQGENYRAKERMETSESYNVYYWDMVFTGESPKLRQWIMANTQFQKRMELQTDMIHSMQVYKVQGYRAYEVYKKYTAIADLDLEKLLEETDAKRILSYLEKAGDPFDEDKGEYAVLEIRLKNGTSFTRFMTLGDFTDVEKAMPSR